MKHLWIGLVMVATWNSPTAFGALCDGSPIKPEDKVKLVVKATIEGKEHSLECNPDLAAPVYLSSDVMTVGSKVLNYKFECKKPKATVGPLVSLDIKGLNEAGKVIGPKKTWGENPNLAVKYMPEMKDKNVALEIHAFGLKNLAKPQHLETAELELTSLNQNVAVESGKGLWHEWQGCFKGTFKKVGTKPAGTLEIYFAGRNYDYTHKEGLRDEKGEWVRSGK